MTPTHTQPIAAAPPTTRTLPRWLAWAAGGALVAGGALALTLVRRPEAALAVGKRIAIAVGPGREQWPSLSNLMARPSCSPGPRRVSATSSYSRLTAVRHFR